MMTKAQMKLFWENPLTVWVMRSLILSMVTLCAYGFFYLLDGKYESKDHALKARSEMFDKFESRIEAQNVAFQERLESHAMMRMYTCHMMPRLTGLSPVQNGYVQKH